MIFFMGELEEFSEALLDQLSIETNEEKAIASLIQKINEDKSFDLNFQTLEELSIQVYEEMKTKIKDFWDLDLPKCEIKYPDLKEFKILKSKKVFAPKESGDYVKNIFEAVANEDRKTLVSLIKKDTSKFFVYSTYAKNYLSKISTTYGDYLESRIYLNKFVLSSYPQIILYKQGPPYESHFDSVNSGFMGALKMTILEEQVHSLQEKLHTINKEAISEVNKINEDLAKIILELKEEVVSELSEHLHLPFVPEEFPIARRANLFFTLNPDNFIVNVLGPDVMTFNRVEIDPKIAEFVPEIHQIYTDWLKPIQTHHASFTVMEGLAEFSVQKILETDPDFRNYLVTFMGTSISAYQVRKNMGKEFVQKVHEKYNKNTFNVLMDKMPSTREIKHPELYLK